MAHESLKAEIRQYIKTNGQNEITGQILQNVLLDMVNDYPSLTGYATQSWVESQGYLTDADLSGYATQDWVEQNYLSLIGGGNIVGGDYTLAITEQGLSFKYNNTEYGGIKLTYGPDGAEFNATGNLNVIGSLTTYGNMIATQQWVRTYVNFWLDHEGYIKATLENLANGDILKFDGTNWVNVPFQTSGGTVTSVATGTGLTGGPITSSGTISISQTYLDYISHGESAYNSLSSYLPLSGDTMNGDLSFNSGNGIHVSYQHGDPSEPEYDTIDIIDGTISVGNGGDITIAGSSVATQYWVTSQGYLTSAPVTSVVGYTGAVTASQISSALSLSNYATQTWVGQNYLSLTGDTWSSGAITRLSKVTGANGLQTSYNDQFGSKSATIKDDSITLNSEMEILGETTTHTTSITSSGITIDGNTVATQYWVEHNYTPSLALGSLNNVSIGSGVAAGDVLTYQGSGQWANQAISFPVTSVAGNTGAVTAAQLSSALSLSSYLQPHISDLAANDMLIYDEGTGWVNTPKSTILSGYATESWVGLNYLPLTGGTLYKSDTTTPLNIKSNDGNSAWLKFSASNDGIFGYLGCALVSGNKTPVFWDTSQHTIWHAGNFTPSDYLPKSGGTLYGTTDTPLYIRSGVSGDTSSWLGFMNNAGTLIGRFGVDSGSPKFYYNGNTYTLATENNTLRTYPGVNVNPATTNGYYAAMTTQSGISSSYWHILHTDWAGGANWRSELALPTQGRNGVYYRSDNDPDGNGWVMGAWVKLLDASNYTDYALAKTGGTISNANWGQQLTLNRPNDYSPSLFFTNNTYSWSIYPNARIVDGNVSWNNWTIATGWGDGNGISETIATREWVTAKYLSLNGDTWSSGHITRRSKVTGDDGLQTSYTDQFGSKSTTIKDDSITLNSEMEILGETTTHSTSITSSGITIDGNTVATQYWVEHNYTPSLALGGLSNVSIGSGVAAGDVLTYQGGGQWANQAISFPVTSVAGYTGAVTAANLATALSLSNYATQTWVGQNYLPLAGGTMTGQIYFGAEDGVVFDTDSYIRTDSDTFLHINGYDAIVLEVNSTEYMRINSSGNVGIGTSSPSEKLHVIGNAIVSGSIGVGTSPGAGYAIDVDGSVRASGFVNSSDERIKDVIAEDVLPSVEDIANAPAVRFKWNELANSKNEDIHLGSIAQYWQPILPETVREGKNGYLGMQYDTIALLSAISNARRIVKLEKEIEELKQRIN